MEARTEEQLASLRQITLVVYILQALSVFVGITAIVGLIINYVKKEDAAGTLYESHFVWQIRTFWWGLLWSVLGFILIFAFGLGLIVWFVAGIWAIYRVVKGWLKWNDRQPVFSA
jgi:uncharacterized membrane protein